MVLANLKLRKTYDSVYDFTEDNLKKVKKMFKGKLKNISDEEIPNHLIELGICDEDVINEVLKQDKKKWFVRYVNDNNGYFEIYEVLEWKLEILPTR